jgi:hypothetical protein
VILPRSDEPWSAYQLLIMWAKYVDIQWSTVSNKGKLACGKLIHVDLVRGEPQLSLAQTLVVSAMVKIETSILPGKKGESYTTFLKGVKEWAGRLGLPEEEYGTHSFRRGGATDQKLQGIPDTMIQENGRWRSANSMHRYFDWDIEFTVRARKLAEMGEEWKEQLVGGQQRCRQEGLHEEIFEISKEVIEQEEEFIGL